MKEEQNASSSANYDVEIYHASSAHTSILKGNAADTAAIRTKKDGHEYETVSKLPFSIKFRKDIVLNSCCFSKTGDIKVVHTEKL